MEQHWESNDEIKRKKAKKKSKDHEKLFTKAKKTEETFEQ